jgi:predicted kinase
MTNTHVAAIHLVLGPVGAGKSTYARRLARDLRGLHLNLDAWMVTLFQPDRPQEGLWTWYAERTQRCIEQMWMLTSELLLVNVPVVLEIGLLRRQERAAFFERAETSAELTLHVLDAPRDVRRERVVRRNEQRGDTFSMVVPLEVFEFASDAWEPLDDDEHGHRKVHFIGAAR